jgi:hypothetical protein
VTDEKEKKEKKKPKRWKPPINLLDGKPVYKVGKPNDQKAEFAQAFFETRSNKKAYMRAYSTENMNNLNIRLAANKIRKDPWVQKRIEELDAELAEETRLSLAHLVRQLQEDRELAHREGQAAAAVQASMHMAKILGHYWERKQIVLTDDLDRMGIEELRSFVIKQAQELGIAREIVNGKDVDAHLLIEHKDGEFETDG